MGDNRERQQHGGAAAATKTAATDSDDERERYEQAAEHDGGNDDTGRPDDVGGKLQRHHAGVVHRRDADADDGAADRGARSPRAGQRDGKTDSRDGDRKDQRQHGHADRVSGAVAGIIGQHRDKMGCPNSAAADGSMESDPDQTGAPRRGAGAVEQADGNRTGEQTYRAAEYDQPPVMLSA